MFVPDCVLPRAITVIQVDVVGVVSGPCQVKVDLGLGNSLGHGSSGQKVGEGDNA